jgi:hypothetical protein
VVIEGCERSDGNLTLLRVKGTAEFKLNRSPFSQFEGLRAAEGTLVFVASNDLYALEAKVLMAGPVARVRLLSNKVADHALELLCLFVVLYVELWLKSFH